MIKYVYIRGNSSYNPTFTVLALSVLGLFPKNPGFSESLEG
jgi:hypothetical protein